MYGAQPTSDNYPASAPPPYNYNYGGPHQSQPPPTGFTGAMGYGGPTGYPGGAYATGPAYAAPAYGAASGAMPYGSGYSSVTPVAGQTVFVTPTQAQQPQSRGFLEACIACLCCVEIMRCCCLCADCD